MSLVQFVLVQDIRDVLLLDRLLSICVEWFASLLTPLLLLDFTVNRVNRLTEQIDQFNDSFVLAIVVVLTIILFVLTIILVILIFFFTLLQCILSPALSTIRVSLI